MAQLLFKNVASKLYKSTYTIFFNMAFDITPHGPILSHYAVVELVDAVST